MKVPRFVTHGIGCTFSLAWVLMLVAAFLASSVFVVLGISGITKCIGTETFGKELVRSLLSMLLGCGGVLYTARVVWQNAVPRRPNDSELQVPEQRPFPLSYATLEQRMEEMHAIGSDDEVVLEQDNRFLSWDDRSQRDIVIQGLHGDDWLAFFWPLRGDEDIRLSRTQLEELCGRENVQLTERCREYQPGAVAFCRGGLLKVYPASSMEDFLEYYPPVQQEADFRPWLEECARMGALDCWFPG